jgi:hypothetical protein
LIRLNASQVNASDTAAMADPEIPEVRAELQREDAPNPKHASLGRAGWLIWAFSLIAFALG